MEDRAVREILVLLKEARREVRRMAEGSESEGVQAVARAMEQAIVDASLRVQGRAVLVMHAASRETAAMGGAMVDAMLPGTVSLGRFGLSPQLLDVVSTYQAGLVRSVTDQLRDSITNSVRLASFSGKPTREVIKDIVNAGVEPIGPFATAEARAEAIARTELNRVPNLAAQQRLAEAAQVVPGLKKRWLATTTDMRTRPDHLAANGQTVPVDGFYTVGGEKCLHPLDPRLSAAMSVNCRCRSIPAGDF